MSDNFPKVALPIIHMFGNTPRPADSEVFPGNRRVTPPPHVPMDPPSGTVFPDPKIISGLKENKLPPL